MRHRFDSVQLYVPRSLETWMVSATRGSAQLRFRPCVQGSAFRNRNRWWGRPRICALLKNFAKLSSRTLLVSLSFLLQGKASSGMQAKGHVKVASILELKVLLSAALVEQQNNVPGTSTHVVYSDANGTFFLSFTPHWPALPLSW